MIALDTPFGARRRGTNAAERLLVTLAMAVGLFGLQIITGSDYAYAGLSSLYLLTVVLAIECNGGIASLFGAIIAYFALQHVLVSQVAKAMFGQGGDVRLDSPIPTMTVEILVMLGFAGAGVLGKLFRPNRDRPLFPPITDLPSLRRLALASGALALLRISSVAILGGAQTGPLRMLFIFDSVAVSAAVASALAESGGKRLTNRFVWAIALPILVLSLVGGSRQGFFQFVLSLVLTGWAFGYRFRLGHYFSAIVLGLVMVFIFSPYSLYARGTTRSGSFIQNANAAADLMTDVVVHPIKYQYSTKQEIDTYPQAFKDADYYKLDPGNAANLLSRFSLIKPTDMIVHESLRSGTTGWTNFSPAFDKIVPGILNPNKGYITRGSGNALAHRVRGLVNNGDYSTGIVVGLPGDAFGAFGYWGACLMPLGLFLINVVVYKLVTRADMRYNLFSLALVVPISHVLAEETSASYLANALYNAPLAVLGLYIATRAAGLVDFKYLRPRRVSEVGREEDGVGATAV